MNVEFIHVDVMYYEDTVFFIYTQDAYSKTLFELSINFCDYLIKHLADYTRATNKTCVCEKL